MDAEFIKAVLFETLPGQCQLRPDIAQAAATAAAASTSMELARTEQGDAADMPDLLDLLFKSALFVAAVTKIVHDTQDIVYREIDRRARKTDKRVESLPDDIRELIIDKAIEHIRKRR